MPTALAARVAHLASRSRCATGADQKLCTCNRFCCEAGSWAALCHIPALQHFAERLRAEHDPQHTTCCDLVHLQPVNASRHCTSLHHIAGAAAAKLLGDGGRQRADHAVGLAESLAKLHCTSRLLRAPQGRWWPSCSTQRAADRCAAARGALNPNP